ncbi:unnamed protein product [Pleuronectes platessa]|uniref:Uncharacterized protein n=1 Tax=Pleuronectes platessa TaxID=8262 RepID=A0A9N7U874_PLEPL|nr:unnamed protein product [Pleuronectes platessa]
MCPSRSRSLFKAAGSSLSSIPASVLSALENKFPNHHSTCRLPSFLEILFFCGRDVPVNIVKRGVAGLELLERYKWKRLFWSLGSCLWNIRFGWRLVLTGCRLLGGEESRHNTVQEATAEELKSRPRLQSLGLPTPCYGERAICLLFRR